MAIALLQFQRMQRVLTRHRGIFETDIETQQPPVLQCVQLKPMDKKDDTQPDRWRLVLSDSENFIQTMLATRTPMLSIANAH